MLWVLIRSASLCCGYLLEAPRRGASNEYPQYMYSSRNKKNFSGYPLLSVAMKIETYSKYLMLVKSIKTPPQRCSTTNLKAIVLVNFVLRLFDHPQSAK